ncbi:MAG: hypothetical protein IPJ06_15735 [Saprospiraceae bacterium]|nr:hypothetical protein [Saprospiraceae bacterium]
MLAHWLKPHEHPVKKRWSAHQIGHRILPFFPAMDEIPQHAVAILGYNDKAADAFRKELYAMGWSFGNMPLVDLGNLRKAEPSFAIQVLKELIDGKKVVILIGSEHDLAVYQYQAYGEKIKGVSACLIHDRPEYTLSPPKKQLPLINRMLKPGEHHLFHLSLLGYQRHHADPAVIRHLVDEQHFELVGLGLVKQGTEALEPILRDADMVNINLSSLAAGYATASNPGPNGIDGMEICQITRYAGLSEKLSSLSVGDWTPTRDRQHVTARMGAQILWYFLEGVSQRQDDFPISMDGLIEFHVQHDHFHDQLVFWKSSRTGRWWLQVPVREKAGHERHRLVPCSYSDYQEACRNELPDRIMQAQFRFR